MPSHLFPLSQEPKDAQTKPGRSLSDARQSRAHRSSSSERSGSRSKKSKRNGSRSRSSSLSHRRKRSPSDASIDKRSKAKSLRDKTGATELDMYLGNVLQSRPQKNEKNILSEWDSFMKHKEKGKPKRTSRSRSRSSSRYSVQYLQYLLFFIKSGYQLYK